MNDKIRTLQFNSSDKTLAEVVPCSGQEFEPYLSAQVLKASGVWQAKTRTGFTCHITLVCHLLTGGPVCFLIPSSTASSTWDAQVFLAWHNQCIEKNHALIIPTDNLDISKSKLLLAPFWGKSFNQSRIAMFGLYCTHDLAADFFLYTVLELRRLPVIFDLDETLIKARGLTAYAREEKAREKLLMSTRASIDDSNPSPEAREIKLKQLEIEWGPESTFLKDYSYIREYSESNCITFPNGGVQRATMVTCLMHYPGKHPEQGQRPVVQISQDAVLTRIDPRDYSQSMLFRIRPYWISVVRPLLAGVVDINGHAISGGGGGERPLIQAFVCTTAKDVLYAHEVWRVLDTSGSLIPSSEWHKRILPLVTKKFISASLGLQRYQDALHEVATASKSIMPFAVIVDDRSEVWEQCCQDQILPVQPWEPYAEIARCLAHGNAWKETPAGLEMLKVGGIISTLRNRIFKELDETFFLSAPQGGTTLRAEIDLDNVDASYAALMPTPPWVSRLLPEIKASAPPAVVPLPPAVVPPPAAPPLPPPAAALPPAVVPQRQMPLRLPPHLPPPQLQNPNIIMNNNSLAVAGGQINSRPLSTVPPTVPLPPQQQQQQQVQQPSLRAPRDPRLAAMETLQRQALEAPPPAVIDSSVITSAVPPPVPRWPGSPPPPPPPPQDDNAFKSLWTTALMPQKPPPPPPPAAAAAVLPPQPQLPPGPATDKVSRENFDPPPSVPFINRAPNASAALVDDDNDDRETLNNGDEMIIPARKRQKVNANEEESDIIAEERRPEELTLNHPSIALSKLAQEQGKLLTIQYLGAFGDDKHLVDVKVDGVRVGYASESTKDEAKYVAVKMALLTLQEAEHKRAAAGGDVGVDSSTRGGRGGGRGYQGRGGRGGGGANTNSSVSNSHLHHNNNQGRGGRGASGSGSPPAKSKIRRRRRRKRGGGGGPPNRGRGGRGASPKKHPF